MSAAASLESAAPARARAAAPQASPSARSQAVRRGLLGLVPILALGVLLVWPLAQVVLASFQDARQEPSTQAWANVLADPAVHQALATTMRVAVMSTAGCLVCGTFIALVLAFVPFPGAGLVTRLIEVVVCFPSFLIPLAFGALFGPVGVVNSTVMQATGAAEGPLQFMGTIHGVVLAEVAYFTPFVVRPVLAMLQGFPRDQIDVASSLGAGPVRIVGRVVLPAMLPTLGSAGVLVFMLTLNEFGIILFTGAQDVITLPLMVYTRAIITFDMPGAAVIACLQAGVSLVVYGAYSALFLRGRRG